MKLSALQPYLHMASSSVLDALINMSSHIRLRGASVSVLLIDSNKCVISISHIVEDMDHSIPDTDMVVVNWRSGIRPTTSLSVSSPSWYAAAVTDSLCTASKFTTIPGDAHELTSHNAHGQALILRHWNIIRSDEWYSSVSINTILTARLYCNISDLPAKLNSEISAIMVYNNLTTNSMFANSGFYWYSVYGRANSEILSKEHDTL